MGDLFDFLFGALILFLWVRSISRTIGKKKSSKPATEEKKPSILESLLSGIKEYEKASTEKEKVKISKHFRRIEPAQRNKPIKKSTQKDKFAEALKAKEEVFIPKKKLVEVLEAVKSTKAYETSIEKCSSNGQPLVFLSIEELKKGIIMSEILSPPRAKRPFYKYF